MCLAPNKLLKRKRTEKNCVPQSAVMTLGTPNTETQSFRIALTADFAEMSLIVTGAGHQENLSTTVTKHE